MANPQKESNWSPSDEFSFLGGSRGLLTRTSVEVRRFYNLPPTTEVKVNKGVALFYSAIGVEHKRETVLETRVSFLGWIDVIEVDL